MRKSIDIYCAGCERDVAARLTDGEEMYPHREDLWDLPFWKCDGCGGFVGCHHKTNNPTIACCCGHQIIPGRIDLEDGRVLVIYQDADSLPSEVSMVTGGQ